MRVIITGDSHTGTLKNGKNLILQKKIWPPEIELKIKALGNGKHLNTPFFINCGDYAQITEKLYQDRIKRLPIASEPDAIYGLCAPFHSNRIWRSLDWTKFVPVALAKTEIPVSDAMLKQIILSDQQYVLELIDIFIQAQKKIFIIETPRPFTHNKAFEDIRPEVILAVDKAYRDLIRTELVERSVDIVSIPAHCIAEDGSMSSDYKNKRKNDMNHGNELFGEIMLQEIFAFLKKD